MCIIAVIDDGISSTKIPSIEFDLDMTANSTNHSCDILDEYSHGTICALIIKKYAPTATIGSIKILNHQTHTGFVENLCSALEWCIKNNIKLINLSLGSSRSVDYQKIKKYIDMAYQHGIIIVAALSNKGVVSYPASLSNVIGVTTDETLKNDEYYMCKSCVESIDVRASSRHQIDFSVPICNSYAAPLITAKILDIIKKHNCYDINSIKKYLNQNSFRKDKVYSIVNNMQCYFYKQCVEPYLFVEESNSLLEIPCVAVICKDKLCNKIISELGMLFSAEGYNNILISTCMVYISENIYYIPSENLSNSVVSYITNKHESDIVLLGIQSSCYTMPKVSCDIALHIGQFNINSQNAFVYDKNISYEHISMLNENNPDISKTIFSEILRLLG